jgi:polyhydroxyalkanoate synthesis regulator phasin
MVESEQNKAEYEYQTKRRTINNKSEKAIKEMIADYDKQEKGKSDKCSTQEEKDALSNKIKGLKNSTRNTMKAELES